MLDHPMWMSSDIQTTFAIFFAEFRPEPAINNMIVCPIILQKLKHNLVQTSLHVVGDIRMVRFNCEMKLKWDERKNWRGIFKWLFFNLAMRGFRVCHCVILFAGYVWPPQLQADVASGSQQRSETLPCEVKVVGWREESVRATDGSALLVAPPLCTQLYT